MVTHNHHQDVHGRGNGRGGGSAFSPMSSSSPPPQSSSSPPPNPPTTTTPFFQRGATTATNRNISSPPAAAVDSSFHAPPQYSIASENRHGGVGGGAMTRLQMLQHSHRHRPMKLIFTLSWAMTCLLLYHRVVFGTAPNDKVYPFPLPPPPQPSFSASESMGSVRGKETSGAVGAGRIDGVVWPETGEKKKGMGEVGGVLNEQASEEEPSVFGKKDILKEVLNEDAKEEKEALSLVKVSGDVKASGRRAEEDGKADMVNEVSKDSREKYRKSQSSNAGEAEEKGDGSVASGGGIFSESYLQNKNKTNSTFDAEEYVRNNIIGVRRTPLSPIQKKQRRDNKRIQDREALASASMKGFLAFFFWICICVVIRLSVSFFVHGSAIGNPPSGSNGGFLFGGDAGTGGRRRRASPTANRRQTQQQQQQARFNSLVRRLNRTRVENGERPISAESLRVVISHRDFTGDDYESLLRFDEESGAVTSFLSGVGATRAEIDRCPSHIIESESDHLLLATRTPTNGAASAATATADGSADESGHKTCSICLERYKMGDHVRRIPCFHTFHVDCIDPWLSRKAICPVCKHPAIA